MCTLLDRCHIGDFVVVLTSSMIATVRTPKINETSYDDFRSDLIASSQYSSARAYLETKAVECIVAENGNHRPGYSLIFDETAPSPARVIQSASIECIPNLTAVGHGIFQEEGMPRAAMVIQPCGQLRLASCRPEQLGIQ